MNRMMDDEEFARTVIASFLDDMPHRLEALKGFIAAEDSSAVGRQAPNIKGVAANMSAEVTRRLAYQIEEAGRAKDLASAERHLAQLETVFEALKEALKQELQVLDNR